MNQRMVSETTAFGEDVFASRSNHQPCAGFGHSFWTKESPWSKCICGVSAGAATSGRILPNLSDSRFEDRDSSLKEKGILLPAALDFNLTARFEKILLPHAFVNGISDLNLPG